MKLITLPLSFTSEIHVNVFKNKNNRTLRETLSSKKYKKYKEKAYKDYALSLDMKLGDFLYKLKNKGDLFYKNFLNSYGDLKYTQFMLKEHKHHQLKGIYFYYVGNKLRYIGRCKDSMKKRVNNGYGKISPKNCFKDGQSTNCKVNALVSQKQKSVSLKPLVMMSNKKIEKYEKELIKLLKPEWNNKLKKEEHCAKRNKK